MKKKENTIGKVIRKYRNYQNLSRRELAEKLPVSPTTIVRYETGEINLPIENLKKLHKILDIPFMEFFPDVLATKGYLAKTDEKLLKTGIVEILEENPELVDVIKFYGKHSKVLSPSRFLNLLKALSEIPVSKHKQKFSLIMKYIKE
jgi:transcriptional regulator with XRE-family HTH domain